MQAVKKRLNKNKQNILTYIMRGTINYKVDPHKRLGKFLIYGILPSFFQPESLMNLQNIDFLFVLAALTLISGLIYLVDALFWARARSKKEKQTQIFMETPYRNQNIFEDILATCQDNTFLCIACDITGPLQFIKTMKIKEWKKTSINIDKKPALFLLHY